MSGVRQDPLIPFLVERFKRAAIVTQFGYEDDDTDMQSAGIAALHRATDGFDLLGPEARLALAPLLEDPDWGVRALAAGRLIKLMPERALSVLRDIKARCPTEAWWTACRILERYENEDT